MLSLLLAGCGAQPTFETVGDSQVFVQPVQRQIRVSMPSDTVLPVMETETGQLYIWRDYEIAVQTLAGGDLDATVRSLCGFGRDRVEILQTAADGFERYDFVWSAAGETGDRVGRACVISDGAYHYCLSAMADAGHGEELREQWNGIFETFRVG